MLGNRQIRSPRFLINLKSEIPYQKSQMTPAMLVLPVTEHTSLCIRTFIFPILLLQKDQARRLSVQTILPNGGSLSSHILSAMCTTGCNLSEPKTNREILLPKHVTISFVN